MGWRPGVNEVDTLSTELTVSTFAEDRCHDYAGSLGSEQELPFDQLHQRVARWKEEFQADWTELAFYLRIEVFKVSVDR